MRSPDGGDEHVRAAGDGRQVSRFGMGNGHGRVQPQAQVGQRLAHHE